LDSDLGARWPDLPNQLREVFHTRDDIDRCASIRLMSRDGSVAVEVTLPDGRSATRTVSRSEDIVPTLESLLLVPQRTELAQASTLEPAGSPPAKPASAPPRAAPARARDATMERRIAIEEHDASEPSMTRQASRLHIELSVVMGGRIGDGQTSLGLGALSFLELTGWLIGFEGRADRYRTLADAAPGEGADRQSDGGALELAVLGGRRFRSRELALDLTAGLAAAMQGTATFEAQPSATGTTISKSSSSTVPRLLLGSRVNFSARSILHPFLGIDGELGPSRAKTDVPGASRLPVWTLGLALGATVGTR
jgi:hypothetical protein